MKEETSSFALSIDEIKTEASALAILLKAQGVEPVAGPLRARFIRTRSALFGRGIFDPMLVRFDSATAPLASSAEIAEALQRLATSL
jgi:hypothetical protein